jgi:hypothetical protein
MSSLAMHSFIPNIETADAAIGGRWEGWDTGRLPDLANKNNNTGCPVKF